jgi:chromosomal replication initiation ATPase DnaA
VGRDRAACDRSDRRTEITSLKYMTIWNEVLEEMRTGMPDEDFRRWFGATAYASDSGDQITVWVPTEAVRRHIVTHYLDRIESLLASMGRRHTHVRLVVGGMDEDDE